MMLPSEQIRVYLAVGATDMRKQIDGLAALVSDVLEEDPFSSALFAFCNQRRDKLKLLSSVTFRVGSTVFPVA